MPPQFNLQFSPNKIQALSDRFSFADDTEARKAGAELARGNYLRNHLLAIAKWKSRRVTSRVNANTDADVSDALKLAVEAKTVRAAIAVLIGLRGIDVPVASAIMAAAAPKRFTIIDVRALEALGVRRTYHSVDYYLEYLAFCQETAAKNNVSLRVLDRALWQWSSERTVEKKQTRRGR